MITTTFKTARFGEITVEPADLISFPQGMIGFPNNPDYVLIQHQPDSPFYWMQSLSIPELAFLVVPPNVFVPDYAPEVNLAAVEEIGISEETPHIVYTVVNIPRGKPDEMTLNLAGPIVIQPETRRAKQLVLEESKYSLRHRIKEDPTERAA